MATLYAQYLAERTSDEILETQEGFATYRFLNDGKTVYIVDIYTVPDVRGRGYAAGLADKVLDVALGREVEIHIHLGAAQVGVRRHGVPLAAGLDHGEPQHELAAEDAAGVDELVEDAAVARGVGAEHGAGAAGERRVLRRIGRVRRIAQQVEARGLAAGGEVSRRQQADCEGCGIFPEYS